MEILNEVTIKYLLMAVIIYCLVKYFPLLAESPSVKNAVTISILLTFIIYMIDYIRPSKNISKAQLSDDCSCDDKKENFTILGRKLPLDTKPTQSVNNSKKHIIDVDIDSDSDTPPSNKYMSKPPIKESMSSSGSAIPNTMIDTRGDVYQEIEKRKNSGTVRNIPTYMNSQTTGTNSVAKGQVAQELAKQGIVTQGPPQDKVISSMSVSNTNPLYVSNSNYPAIDLNEEDEMKYSQLPPEMHKPLGKMQVFDTTGKPGYSFVDPKDWYPPTYRPPICVSNNRCPTQPVSTGKAYAELLEFDDARRVMPPDNINVKYVSEKLNAGKI